MAGTINPLAGAAAGILPSPAGSSSNRSANPRTEEHRAPVRSAPIPPEAGTQVERTLLTSSLERARSAGLSQKTSLSFERDDESGKIYLSIKDRRTGEEVIRIPKKYLEGGDLPEKAGSRVDVRI
jgi:uncharacterized FlaG/YvyC family protein